MSIGRLVLGLALGAFGACEPASDTAAETPADPGLEGPEAPTGSTGGPPKGTGDGTDGSEGPPNTGITPTGVAPTQSAVTARVSGRTGHDLTVSLIVEDSDGDAAGVWIRALDASGAERAAFRGGLEDALTTAESRVPFDPPSSKPSFVAEVTLRGVALEAPQVAKLEVAVFDLGGNAAEPLVVEIAPQPEVGLGDACDPDFVANRCAQGLGCRGTPALCSEGVAPDVTKVAYFVDAAGPRILVAGADPEDDLATLTIHFLDAAGAPIDVDLDGDGSPDGATFDVDASGACSNGEFFVVVTPAAAFAEVVPQVAVVAVDGAGHAGEQRVAKQSTPPKKGNGAACDPRGFDLCSGANVCAGNTAGTANQCQPRLNVQQRRCDLAPVVEVAGGVVTVTGIASGSSAWDAPTGCASADPVGRPEGVVTLRLTKAFTSLRLTTAREGTNFDTVVYVMDQCGTAQATALQCSDDSTEGSAVSAAGAVELELVGPGDYTVVVDAWGPEGGTYTLEIAAE